MQHRAALNLPDLTPESPSVHQYREYQWGIRQYNNKMWQLSSSTEQTYPTLEPTRVEVATHMTSPRHTPLSLE